MKTLAILTDIHGNSPALKAVLDDIDTQNVDHIFCLGDVVGIGPDSNEVLNLLTTRNNVTYILGNHDLAVMAAYWKEEPPGGHQSERKHHEWLAEKINPRYIQFMRDWPKTHSLYIGETQLYFTHYHLKNNEWMSVDNEPSIEKLDQLYFGSEYKLIAFGHHHIVHYFVSNERIYLNPGSLGCNHESVARYGLIRINKDTLDVELKKVPYHNSDFLKSYEQLKVPDRDFIMKVFYGVQKYEL